MASARSSSVPFHPIRVADGFQDADYETLQQLHAKLPTLPATQDIAKDLAAQGHPDPQGGAMEQIQGLWNNLGPNGQALALVGAPMALIGLAMTAFGNGGLGSILMMLLGGGAVAGGLGGAFDEGGAAEGLGNWVGKLLGGGAPEGGAAGTPPATGAAAASVPAIDPKIQELFTASTTTPEQRKALLAQGLKGNSEMTDQLGRMAPMYRSFTNSTVGSALDRVAGAFGYGLDDYIDAAAKERGLSPEFIRSALTAYGS